MTLERRVPMQRGGAPLRRVPLQRATRLPRQTPARTPRAITPRGRVDTGPTRATRTTVHERDEGRCLVCGGPAVNVHHRQGRGMGGRQGAARAASNASPLLMSLCGSGTTGCHGWITDPPRGVTADHLRALGYVVRRSTRDPGQVPVWTWRNQWVRLDLLDDHGHPTAVNLPAPPLPHRPQ